MKSLTPADWSDASIQNFEQVLGLRETWACLGSKTTE